MAEGFYIDGAVEWMNGITHGAFNLTKDKVRRAANRGEFGRDLERQSDRRDWRWFTKPAMIVWLRDYMHWTPEQEEPGDRREEANGTEP